MPMAEVSAATRAADPVAVCAADEAYALPLAVMLHSAASHLAPGSRLRVYLIDTGLSDSSWVGLRETLLDLPIDVTRVRWTVERLSHLRVSHHISHTAYVRLMAAELLPADLDRVLYLDADLLWQDDLSQLWGLPLDGAWVGAVPDIACPFIDARRADCNFRRASPYLATLSPVRNWRALGLDPRRYYFNSGLMLIDLAAWRRHRLSQQFLQCLAAHAPFVWCWDQYPLNVVLAERWRPLPMRWNQGSHAHEYPDADHSPIVRAEFVDMLRRPAAIHFTTEHKPWQERSRHPARTQFLQAVRQTAWSDWSPPRETISWRRRWDLWAASCCKRATVAFRKLNACRYAEAPR